MITKMQTILGIILAAVLLMGGAYFVLRDGEKIPATEELPATTTPGTSNNGTEPTFTIIPIEQKEKLPSPPDIEKPLTFSDDVFPENKQKMLDQWKITMEELKKDHNSLDAWLQMGLLRKTTGDYEGAREAWEYASIIRPKNSVSFANLGVLYGYYLKDQQKAEKNFLKAIENDKVLTYFYAQTADFYLDVIKNKEKAIGILEQGIKEVPESEGKLLQAKIDEIK